MMDRDTKEGKTTAVDDLIPLD